ncbi:small ribosomal subunit protein bS6m isoform X2 [Drosophila virilis]|uniref:Small ribosomal subunit protein bS6m n=1 Tax=Drosophila virilis TaxID=7244 RepID=A0A0Q9WUY3_DROVI|nr:probable 28S ribosomal protein S6, mitochondrial isoform X2 [Drosophila virilis]KRF84048.1 uncharacterized protein Dvir_GJ12460, isoform B [Drosophila virilis]
MPSYELALVLRQLPRPELISVIKRTAEAIFDKGGIIRKFENLGTRALPFKVEEPEDYECTLHEEMLPPAYRKDVQELIDIAKRKQKPKYNYNSGLDYYPFQK